MPHDFDLHSSHDHSEPHHLPILPRVDLEITRGRARHKLRQVTVRAYLIGRANDCDLVLSDPRFGDVHAYLFRDPHRVSIRWLGCGPEVTVNGQLVDRLVQLEDQDCIRTGPYEFKMHLHREIPDPGGRRSSVAEPHGEFGAHRPAEAGKASAGLVNVPQANGAVHVSSGGIALPESRPATKPLARTPLAKVSSEADPRVGGVLRLYIEPPQRRSAHAECDASSAGGPLDSKVAS